MENEKLWWLTGNLQPKFQRDIVCVIICVRGTVGKSPVFVISGSQCYWNVMPCVGSPPSQISVTWSLFLDFSFILPAWGIGLWSVCVCVHSQCPPWGCGRNVKAWFSLSCDPVPLSSRWEYQFKRRKGAAEWKAVLQAVGFLNSPRLCPLDTGFIQKKATHLSVCSVCISMCLCKSVCACARVPWLDFCWRAMLPF